MFKLVLVSSVSAILLVGCDTAAKQQQAEAARAAATAATLKQAGGELHDKTRSEAPVEPAANDTP